MFTPRQKRHLTKILTFGGFFLVFGSIYAIVEKGIMGSSEIYPSTGNPYDVRSAFLVIITGSTLVGLLFGSLESFVFYQLFRQKHFSEKIILKTGLYLLMIFLFLLCITFANNSITLNKNFWEEEVILTAGSFVFNFAFLSVVIYISTMIAVILFLIEVSDKLGLRVFSDFLTGKYYRPQVEERIFMFLDMKSSTTIAEELGHQKYYDLLNEYYADINSAVLDTYGEIYQYVGDEIVVSWDLQTGLKAHHCLQCFFKIKSIFVRHAKKYEDRFGLVPRSKAGMHYGQVTTGEVGVIKKELLFTGDVLNTTSRIQESCNPFGVDLLLSEDLVNRLEIHGKYLARELGETTLRGRKAPVKLFTLEEEP